MPPSRRNRTAATGMLLERYIFWRVAEPALEFIARSGRPDFVDKPQNDRFSLGHETQRLEPARPIAVVFQEIAVHVDGVEQDFRDRLVATRSDKGRLKIAAAQMHGDGHVGWSIRHGSIDHARIDRRQLIRILTAVRDLGALRVAEGAKLTSSSCR